MKVKTNTGEIHEVWKYLKSAEGDEQIWSHTWQGEHIIGQDCEFVEDEVIQRYKDQFADVRNFLLRHPDREMIEDACRHIVNPEPEWIPIKSVDEIPEEVTQYRLTLVGKWENAIPFVTMVYDRKMGIKPTDVGITILAYMIHTEPTPYQP